MNVGVEEFLPSPISGTLDELMDGGTAAEEAYKVFIGHNLGNRVFMLQVPMHKFAQISEVANDPERDGDAVAQRKLDLPHAQRLAQYILKGLVAGAIERRVLSSKPILPGLAELLNSMGRQPYMSLQPLVANIRSCAEGGRSLRGERVYSRSDNSTACFSVFLSQEHVLWVVDGQHRRYAMKLIFEFLDEVLRKRSYPKKGSLYSGSGDVSAAHLAAWQDVYESARTWSTVSVEVHLGLNPDQERQLFHDLNNLGKRVDRNLALKFDKSNPVNLFIKEVLHDEDSGLGMQIVEQEVKDWKADTGALTLKDAVAINAILFLNKTNISGALPALVEERQNRAKQFWEAVSAIQGFGEPEAKLKTVAAQPVVLKALAKLMFDFAFSNRRQANWVELIQRLLEGISSEVDFSHENPMWRFYDMSETDRALHGVDQMADYLPSAEGGNRDIGSFQDGVMRFGAKHNDIFPIIGDMVRWKLKLPNRHS